MDRPKTGLEDYRDSLYSRYVSSMGRPTTFDESRARDWGRPYDRYLRGWLPSNPEARILDVACGDGKLLFFYQKRGLLNAEGVDRSPEQIDLARSVTEAVTQGDVMSFLESHVDTYDLITGIDFIEHLTKDEACRFLELVSGSLRPGGRLILQTPNADSPWGMSYRYGDFTHETCYNPSSLTQLLRLFGFESVDVREAGPSVHGVISLSRFVLWALLRQLLGLWNMIETGDKRSGIFTRVFLASAVKV
jgi:2-polyprenyl-3-methyl-5-hydroxy-6-metoxy-1,4-benzoquinol methylase